MSTRQKKTVTSCDAEENDAPLNKLQTASKQKTKDTQQSTSTSSDASKSNEEINLLYERLTKHFDVKITEIKKMFTDEINDLKRSNDFICNQYEDLLSSFKNIQDLHKETKFLREENDNKNIRISSLESRLADLEQEKLSDSLEMAGVDLRPGEPPIEAVLRVASSLGVPLLQDDLRVVIKTQDRRQNTPDKLRATFHSLKTRDSILSLKNAAKTLNTKSPIFISEILTPYYKELLWKTKQLAKDNHFQFVWFKTGKLLVRKGPGDKIIHIKHENDFKKIV